MNLKNIKSTGELFETSLANHFLAMKSVKKSLKKIDYLIDNIINSINVGGKIIVAGNGGSAADAQHFVAELTIRYKKERRSLPAISLTSNSSSVTAGGNDYGYQNVFSRQLEGLCKKEDTVILISTSGNSENILNAYNEANKITNKIWVLTSKKCDKSFENLIAIDSEITAHIQEAHYFILHLICEKIDLYYDE